MGGVDGDVIALEDTSDPLLRRAISDASDGEVKFRDIAPVFAVAEGVSGSGATAVATESKAKHTFVSLRAMFAHQRPAGTSGALVLPQPTQPVVAVEPVMPAETTPSVVASAVNVPAVAAAPAQAPVATVGAASKNAWLVGSMARTWAIGLAGLVLFVGANMAVGSYYADRVYPGVKAGSLAVGGWKFDELHQKLPQSLAKPTLAAVIGGKRYEMDGSFLGNPSFPELERSVKEAGRGTSLPLVGVVQTLFSKPVAPTYALSDEAVARSVQKLEALVNRRASDAAVMVMGTNVLVLSEKPGVQLDTAAAAAGIRAAYGRVATATLEPVHIRPEVSAAGYANDVVLAQTMIGLNIQVTVRKAKYAPTAEQIGSWLVFAGPGKGVSVNPAGVAAWVATIPGAFDRVGTVDGVVAALNSRQAAALAPSIAVKKRTANPSPVSLATAWPVINYNYCVDEGGTSGAGAQVASVLGSGGSWTLGGRVQFTRVASACNFVLKLGDAKAKSLLDPACEKQTTCRIHNDLMIGKEAWAKAPAAWSGDISSYRTELVNHVVGQWLGFDHPSCSALAAETPLLSAPSVIIPGCSPKWYAVPAEMQDAKVLAGF